jgi:hypothetical protein
MEEPAAARTQPRHDVLDIRGARGCGAENRRIERPAPGGEQSDGGHPAHDLEPPIGNVLVSHSIGRNMKQRAEKHSKPPRERLLR